MELLLFVLLGHVCLISLGVTDLVKILSDDLDNILLDLGVVRSHAQNGVKILVVGIVKGLQGCECKKGIRGKGLVKH